MLCRMPLWQLRLLGYRMFSLLSSLLAVFGQCGHLHVLLPRELPLQQ
jgi:hypothetical protein